MEGGVGDGLEGGYCSNKIFVIKNYMIPDTPDAGVLRVEPCGVPGAAGPQGDIRLQGLQIPQPPTRNQVSQLLSCIMDKLLSGEKT
jgi:hypothetical protein